MSRTYWTCAWVLVAVGFAASLGFQTQLPDRIPIHWNLEGKIDGWGDKSTIWLFPCVMLGLLGMFAILPAISPRPFDLDRNNSAYLFIMVLVIGLMGFMHAITLWAAMHPRLDVSRAIMAGVMLMIALMGNVMGKIKRNLYMGMRTPWTLANERVWTDTHRVAAWWMVGAGLFGFVLSLSGLPVWVPLIVLLPAVLWPVLFSYLLYKRLERTGQLPEDISTTV